MTARKTWRPARSIDLLFDRVNHARPNRSKRSDGIVGDTAHASRKSKSDHNPNSAGVVRAGDVTHDPKGGVDCNQLAAEVAALLGVHPALGSGAYVIWNRRIISTDKLHKGWRRYLGVNGHTQHAHVSVATAAWAYDSDASWPVLAEPALLRVSPSLRDTFERELKAWIYADGRTQETPAANEAWRVVGVWRERLRGYSVEQWQALIAELDAKVRRTSPLRRLELAGNRRAAAHARTMLNKSIVGAL